MSRWIRSGWLALAFVLAGGAVEARAAQANDDPGYRVIGYVSDGDKLPPISASKLDVINFAFAHVNPQHEVFLPRETATRSLAGLTALRKDNPDLKIMLSVGGWGAGNFSEAAATEAARARFADTAVELVRRHDLDGVDIDWEYPGHPGPGISYSADDKANFPLMLEAVRARLDALGKTQDGRHYLLTIAAADGDAARGLDLPRISAILDWINLMTYDFYGSLKRTTGHHAGLRPSRTAEPGSRNTVQAVEEFLAGGVPPRKLHVGLAFYGRTFDEVTDGNNGLDRPFASGGGFISWREIARSRLDKEGYVRHWDEDAQAAWLWNPQLRKMISYEDPQALRAKVAYVREKGLGGVMYWEQSNDPDEQLLDVAREALFSESPARP